MRHFRARDGLLTGWGMTAPTRARRISAGDEASITEVLTDDADPRGVIARGLGRSYGDAAQNSGGTVVDGAAYDRISRFDAETGVVVCDGGVTLDQLMRSFIPFGWFVPVTPGTRQVTVGGAIAADIHGKNHHLDGTFTQHVLWIRLATPVGEFTVSPDDNAELFWATAGGMGLTGVILEAAVRLLPIESAFIAVDTERTADLDATMAAMVEGDDRYRYSVAWIDSVAQGKRLGRGVLTRGDHLAAEALPTNLRDDPLKFSPSELLSAPKAVPTGLLNKATIRAFNELWFRKAPKHQVAHPETITAFFHPLDGIREWRRLYGKTGFVQYQFVLPDGAEDTLRICTERLSSQAPSFLTVLKRFGPSNPAPLSFPAPGWTLALDIPAGTSGLSELLDDLDDLVAADGGRIYLAKDSRMSGKLLSTMYPRLDEWRAAQHKVDPAGIMQSDMSRRLGLTASCAR
jgi:decaprenylphospho-beta-D-ribofuranose 2-oxidase